MTDWRIYYDDGFRLDGNSDTEIPLDRRTGILVIAFRDPEHQWSFWFGKDYYLEIAGNWLGVDLFGLIDQLLRSPRLIHWALAGRTVTYEYQRSILQRALAECDPPKTGWHDGERQVPE